MLVRTPSETVFEHDFERTLEGATSVAILIVGMHRSGTSALAGALNKLGVAVPEDLMPPTEFNARGYFESQRVVAFNERLLARLGSPWDDPLPISYEWVRAPLGAAAIEELIAILDEELRGEPMCLFKDPRLCRLAPIWSAALAQSGRATAAVLPYRNPLEVAGSLQARDGIGRSASLFLWLQHVLLGERFTRKLPRSFASYDELMTDWRAVSAKLQHELGVSWPRDLVRAAPEVDAFLGGELRHQQTAPIAAHDPLDGLCARAWDALQRFNADPYDAEAQAAFDAIWAEFEAGASVFAPLVAEHRRAIAALSRERELLSHDRASLSEELDKAIRANETAVADLAAQDAQLQTQDALLQARDRQLNERRSQVDRLLGERAAAEAHIAGLVQEVSARDETLAAQQLEIARLQQIEASTLWAVSYPLRRALVRLPWLRTVSRRALKLFWWTATFKLVRKLGERRTAERAQLLESSEAVAAVSEPQEIAAEPEAVPAAVREPVLRLPLDYAPGAEGLKTAILLHAYHVEVVPQIAALLSRVPFAADLVVTTDTEAKRDEIAVAFAGWKAGALEVRVTPNRGRNVAPQLIACRDVWDSHELVLILHTKVSGHTDELAGWREFLLQNLVGGPAVMRSAMEAFVQLPKLGVLAPRTFPPVRRHLIWGENYETCRALADRLGFPLYPDSPLDFPAGFMFWARTAALRPLLDLDLDWEDFAPENGQKDGTIAHTLERLIFHSCELSGLRWARAGVEVDPVEPEVFHRAADPQTLGRALAAYGRTLLLPGRPPRPTSNIPDADTVLAASDPKAAFRELCRAELDAFLAGDGRLALPAASEPHVSVVLVLFNQAELTFECLRSLANTFDGPGEVIIVDNASSDRTVELLERIDGARIVRNAENLHFLRGVNQAAALARGRHLLLLNNDVRLEPGSIAAAAARLDAEPDLGAVGGRITLLDGGLQEAGSIVWRDGTCLGYGRNQDPWAPEFQFRRDVDYCSGAFLMTPRALFEELGGLDEAFAPAYYEETDFCMRIRAAGRRIAYEPRVRLQHFEFGSSASSEQALALQAQHRGLFVARHAEVLDRQHLPAGASPLSARMRDSRRRVLIVDDQVPYPALGAGYPRALDIVRAAAGAGWFVTYYPAVYPEADYAEAYGVLPAEVELAAERGAGGLGAFLRERAGYYDAAIVSRPHNMEVFRAALAEAPGALDLRRVVYDAEAIFAARDVALARLQGASSAPPRRSVAAEVALADGVGAVLAVNAREAGSFRRVGTQDVRVVGHALRVRPTAAGFDARRDLLFVGALDEDDSPNADSLEFFVREVMPKLDARIGADYALTVAGRCGAARVRALASDRVRLLGRVEDLAPLYERSRVFVAPTRYAAGIPMKVHEAAAHGLPAAATPLLAEQLGWSDGEALAVGAGAEAFAHACARLYEDAELWARVRAGALARVAAECDPAAFTAKIATVLDMAAAPATDRAP